MTKIISLVFLIAFLNSSIAFSQSDEIHLKDGTIIKGEIIFINKNRAAVEVSKKGKKKGKKIKGYKNIVKVIDYTEDKVIIYERRNIKGLPTYLSGLVIDGEAKLYITHKTLPRTMSQLNSPNVYTFYYAYTENKGEFYKALPNSLTTPFKKRTCKYFSDCKVLVSKVKSNELKYEDFIEIVKTYNASCKS